VIEFDAWLEHGPYAFERQEKREHLLQRLRKLTEHHQEHSEPYRNILQGLGCDVSQLQQPEDIPFLPVSLFKTLTLKSVPDEEVVKTMTSSGTTGQAVSRIFLD